MNETVLNIILLAIPVLGAIVTGFVIPLILSKIGAEKLTVIVKWVGYAVSAAEMIFPQIKTGVEKKAYVIDFIDKTFNKRKIVITKDQIEILIESVVAEMNKTKLIENK